MIRAKLSVTIVVVLTTAICLFAPAGAQAHLAVAKLGPPPVECQSSFGVECVYGLAPLYMGNTYIGGLHISPHLIHQGETVTESFYPKIVKCISGQPCASSWGWQPPGEKVSPCGSEDLSCTFKAIYPGAYPPSETSSGWSGGWDVDELGICGFNGCANASDYFYVVPENLRGLSGSVRNTSGEPLAGAVVNVEGAAGSETVEVDPATGTYSVILPPGHYSVTVDAPSGGEVHPVQCTTGRIKGAGECEIDLTEKDGNASFIQSESLSIVGTPKVAEPTSGSAPEQFKIAISQASEEPVTVKWATADSSATVADHNYKEVNGEVTILPGARSVPVTVQVMPGNGTAQTPAIYYFAKIVSVVSGEVTINQKARSALGTILIPGVSGRITGPPKTGGGEREGVPGVTVTLTGTSASGQSLTRTTTSESNGEYHFRVDPGTYTVTPTLSAKGTTTSFNTEACEGEKQEHSCKLTLPAGASSYTANFTGGLLLLGKVSNVEGEGVPGVSVSISGPENKNVETETEGGFKAELAPGTYTVSAQPHEKHEYFPVSSEDCVAEASNCTVSLTKDRSVEFTECVLPNENGEPLPPKTPSPIPGAVTDGQLEAVGCFTHHPDGTYSSERNVRLDGVDVKPTEKGSIVIDGTSVTSTTKALVKVDGFTLLAPDHFHWTYGGSSVETNDISSSAATLNFVPNFFGIPLSLGSGGALSSPMLQSTTGKTTFTLAGQAVIPFNTTASWDQAGSGFTLAGKPVPSLGLSGSLVSTNRGGLQAGTFCAKVANAAPFGPNGGELSQAVLCFTPKSGEWSLQALYNLPGAASQVVRQVNFTGSIAPGGKEGKLGYKLQSAEFQARGLGGAVQGENGIPIGYGVFWNGVSGGWVNDLTSEPAKLKSFNLGGALTLGPEVGGYAALSFDGQIKVQPQAESEGKAIPQLYEAEGLITAFHGSRWQLPLGHGKARFTFAPYFSTELEAEIGLTLGFLGGLKVQASGFWDGEHKILQLSGGGTVTLGSVQETAEALINGKAAVVCLTGGNRAQKGSGFAVGGLYNLVTHEAEWFPEGTCDIGKYRVANPVPTASSVRRSAHFAVHRGLAGEVIAVKGAGGTPAITVRGPGGLKIATAAASPWLAAHGALTLRDEATHTTYVALHKPPAGSYTIATQPGSVAISSVLQAGPAPRAHVQARVSPASCQRTVSYRASIPHGVRVALYAKGGHRVSFLSNLHAGKGHARFTPSTITGGTGTIIAVESSDGRPRSVSNVAGFKLHQVSRPGRVTGLHLKGRRLTWSGPCGALSYTVTITVGKSTTTLTSSASRLTLPSQHGAAIIAVSAHGPGGAGPAREIKAKL